MNHFGVQGFLYTLKEDDLKIWISEITSSEIQQDRELSFGQNSQTKNLVTLRFLQEVHRYLKSIFGIQRSNQVRLVKGAKGPFSECCCLEISAEQHFTKKITSQRLRTRGPWDFDSIGYIRNIFGIDSLVKFLLELYVKIRVFCLTQNFDSISAWPCLPI
jgi:hypothetical protein